MAHANWNDPLWVKGELSKCLPHRNAIVDKIVKTCAAYGLLVVRLTVLVRQLADLTGQPFEALCSAFGLSCDTLPDYIAAVLPDDPLAPLHLWCGSCGADRPHDLTGRCQQCGTKHGKGDSNEE